MLFWFKLENLKVQKLMGKRDALDIYSRKSNNPKNKTPTAYLEFVFSLINQNLIAYLHQKSCPFC